MPTSTYSPQDAIQLAQTFAHGIPIKDVEANVCDMINSMIWTYYPWGWSIQSLPPTNLFQLNNAPNPIVSLQQQDYPITGAWFQFPITLQAGGTANNNYGGGWPIALAPNGLSEVGNLVTVNTVYPHNLPLAAILAGQTGTILGATVAGYNTTLAITNIPTTSQIQGTITAGGLTNSGGSGQFPILRPLKMRIARLDSTPPEYRELAALGNLGVELTRTAGIDTMKAVGWFSSQDFFRFDVSPQVGLGQILQLLGEFQVMPTRITDESMAKPFAFPDQYFNVFMEGLKWKIYQLSDDARAGSIQMNKNGSTMKVYTGQLGIFMEQIMSMARTEDLGAGDEFQYPEQPLGVGRSYFPGMYGL